ncbi:MAG: PAS domain-containing protein [Planctomycetes bacterium]|nr:PAS domain-containing protein [Planctomycetota bacterium]
MSSPPRDNPYPATVEPVRGLDIMRTLARHYVFLLPLFVACASSVFYFSVRARYLDNWERHATDVAEDLNIDLLRELGRDGASPQSSDWTNPETLGFVDRHARQYLRTVYVTQINVFSEDRTLVYSTRPGLAPRPSGPNDKLDRALGGESVSGIEKALEAPDFPKFGHTVDLLETYVPMRFLDSSGEPTGRVFGAFEIYQNAESLTQGLRELGTLVLVGSVGILAVLGFALLGTARRVSVMVQRERRAQATLQERLKEERDGLENEVERRTEEVRREREALSTILDEAPSAFVLLDRDGRVEYASRRFCELSAVGAKDPRRELCWEVCRCTYEPGACPARAAIESGATRIAVEPRTLSDGSVHFLEHTAVPISSDGSPIRVIEVIRDVTERLRSDEELARASRLATAGELAAAVAHEVRNAATTTKLFLQLLAERPHIDPRDAQPLSAALSSVSRMEALVENLLRLARPARPEMVPADAVEVLRSAVELVRPEAHRRRVRVRGPTPSGALVCLVDRALLAEALLNLLLNAVQAFDDTAAPDGREVEVMAFADSGAVLLIADNGPGIPANDRLRVFDPFFTTKPSGTGLGLPIARRIIEGHAGTLSIRPREGGGTVARIVLPIDPGKELRPRKVGTP